jgi:predicted membrane protein
MTKLISIIGTALRGEMRDAYKILVGKSEGKIPVGRPRSRWKGNIRMNLKEIRWEDVNWMHLDQDSNKWRALVNTVMNLRVP